MKITTRCGGAVIDQFEALPAKAAEAKLLRVARVRADTTVLAANVQRPTDSGLLTKAIARMSRQIGRIEAAGAASRTGGVTAPGPPATSARQINSRLQPRQAPDPRQTQAVVRRITSELADLAIRAGRDAGPVLRNARRALAETTGRRAGQLRRAIDDLARTLRHTATVVAQTGGRRRLIRPCELRIVPERCLATL
jgi:IS5 family transposase